MTDQTALEAVRALGEQAILGKWKAYRNHKGRMVLARYEGDDWVEFAEFFVEQAKRDADRGNAAYAALAATSIDAAVAALEKTGHRPYRENTTHWHEAGEQGFCPGCAVLDTIRKAAQQAQK